MKTAKARPSTFAVDTKLEGVVDTLQVQTGIQKDFVRLGLRADGDTGCGQRGLSRDSHEKDVAAVVDSTLRTLPRCEPAELRRSYPALSGARRPGEVNVTVLLATGLLRQSSGVILSVGPSCCLEEDRPRDCLEDRGQERDWWRGKSWEHLA